MKHTFTLLLAALLFSITGNATVYTPASSQSFSVTSLAAYDYLVVNNNITIYLSGTSSDLVGIRVNSGGKIVIDNTTTVGAGSSIYVYSGGTVQINGGNGTKLKIGNTAVGNGINTYAGPGYFSTSGGFQTGSVPLGVELLNFSVVPSGNVVDARFATANEHDIAFFELEHSTNGIDYLTTGKMITAGNPAGQYLFSSVPASVGNNFYRLSIHGTDASITYSQIASAKIGKTLSFDPAIFPNPASNNLTINASSDLNYVAVDMAGRVVLVGSFAAADLKSVDISALQKGNYVLKLNTGSESKAFMFSKLID